MVHVDAGDRHECREQNERRDELDAGTKAEIRRGEQNAAHQFDERVSPRDHGPAGSTPSPKHEVGEYGQVVVPVDGASTVWTRRTWLRDVPSRGEARDDDVEKAPDAESEGCAEGQGDRRRDHQRDDCPDSAMGLPRTVCILTFIPKRARDLATEGPGPKKGRGRQ